jgi:DNA topoisomerase-3
MAPIKCVFVAEKNSVAKAIVAALGGGQRVPGPSQMNPITECKGQVGARGGGAPQAADVRVTSVQGHLMEQDFKGVNRKWHGCAPIDLFDAEVEKFVPDKFKDNAKQLKVGATEWRTVWPRRRENSRWRFRRFCATYCASNV